MTFVRVPVFGIALLITLASAAPARADQILWNYTWSSSPGIVYSDTSTASYITLTNEQLQTASGNSAEGSLEAKQILAVVHTLPDNLRIPFCLHYEGYKYQEIADLIDITLGTIKSRIHLARKLLREQISREMIGLN